MSRMSSGTKEAELRWLRFLPPPPDRRLFIEVLAEYGVRCVIVHEDAAVATAGSRSICVQGQSLGIPDRWDPGLARGAWGQHRKGCSGRCAARITATATSAAPRPPARSTRR